MLRIRINLAPPVVGFFFCNVTGDTERNVFWCSKRLDVHITLPHIYSRTFDQILFRLDSISVLVPSLDVLLTFVVLSMVESSFWSFWVNHQHHQHHLGNCNFEFANFKKLGPTNHRLNSIEYVYAVLSLLVLYLCIVWSLSWHTIWFIEVCFNSKRVKKLRGVVFQMADQSF